MSEADNTTGGTAVATIDAPASPPARVPLTAGHQLAALIPRTIEEAWRLSEAFSKANILPRGITTAPQVMLVICGGAEVGFGPFQSLQSFYLVNNRLCLWGDAIPALLWSNGFKLKEWFEGEDAAYPDTMKAKCIVTRPDGTEIEGEFSVADAKEGKLWAKEGPWQTSRKRMLKMRARAFAARDGAPDVLRGVQIREEVEDYDATPASAATATAQGSGVAARLAAEGRPIAGAGDAKGFNGSHGSGDAAAGAGASESGQDAPIDAEVIPHDKETGEIIEDRPQAEATAGAPTADAEAGSSDSATPASSDSPPAEEASSQSDSGAQPGDGAPAQVAYPTTGEIYCIASVKPAKDGRRQTFRHGKPHSSVGAKGLANVVIYDLTEQQLTDHFSGIAQADAKIAALHAGAAAKDGDPEKAEAEPGIRTNGEDRQDPEQDKGPEADDLTRAVSREEIAAAVAEAEAGQGVPAAEAGVEEEEEEALPPGGFMAEITAMQEWEPIKARLITLYGGEDWRAYEEADQNAVRRMVWGHVKSLIDAGKIKVPLSEQPGAFRLWLEAEENPDTIIEMFESVRYEPAYKRMNPMQIEILQVAVASRLDLLRGA